MGKGRFMRLDTNTPEAGLMEIKLDIIVVEQSYANSYVQCKYYLAVKSNRMALDAKIPGKTLSSKKQLLRYYERLCALRCAYI